MNAEKKRRIQQEKRKAANVFSRRIVASGDNTVWGRKALVTVRVTDGMV